MKRKRRLEVPKFAKNPVRQATLTLSSSQICKETLV